jgi:threonine/homoserine/homoserine lactone efflux protein
VIVTPGPDTALTVRNVLLGGRSCGAATALGVVIGLTVWTVAASAGIAALPVASEPALVALGVRVAAERR